MTSEEASQLKDYMRAVVDEGTATMLSGQSYSVAGKTGTAEYSMTDRGKKTHSWFVGFTNLDNPELVISVIIEGYDGNAGAKAVPNCKAGVGFLLLSIEKNKHKGDDRLHEYGVL